MAEEIQQLILDALASKSKIDDTRSLILPGQTEPANSQDAQTIIIGALNSLLSREVHAYRSTSLISVEKADMP